MQISWTSQQGRKRQQNSDAAAVGYCGEFLVATIVDAAERETSGKVLTGTNERGERLAQYWATTCTETILGVGSVNDTERVIAQLAEHQKTLRECFLHDIASYAVLILNEESGALKWLFTGDCRIGFQHSGGDTEWLNTPHRLENAEIYKQAADRQEKLQTSTEKQIAQHTLTQSLNARRFLLPELFEASLPANANVIAATDGFWCEHLFTGTPLGNLEDDASWLTITPGKRSVHETTDSPNFHLLTEDSK
ncbi:hypothetical protein [Spongiibacter tropicus]|uniref:hypothetical protein n=1 Tax=Spongiibacter tropicus TaxID=454602 RepID=UPI0024E1AC94|nr:hypothetical protein [Spongiibacter tropicus]